MPAAVLFVTVMTSKANTAGMYLIKAGEICSDGKYVSRAVTQVLIVFSMV